MRYFSPSPSSSSRATPSEVGVEQNYLVSHYRHLVQDGNVIADQHQLKALAELDRLRNQILKPPTNAAPIDTGSEYYSKFTNFFSGIADLTTPIGTLINPTPKGVYLHGGVGCGKTFCMDLFFDSLPVKDKSKGIIEGVNDA